MAEATDLGTAGTHGRVPGAWAEESAGLSRGNRRGGTEQAGYALMTLRSRLEDMGPAVGQPASPASEGADRSEN